MKHTKKDNAKIYDILGTEIEEYDITKNRLEYINLWLLLFFLLTISLLLVAGIGWGAYYLLTQ